MDGVLVASNELHWKAYRSTFRTRGRELSWEEYLRVGIGASREIVIRRVFGELPPHELADLMAMKERAVRELLRTEGVETIPGAKEFVTAARTRGLLTAVATSSRSPDAFLAAAGLDRAFDAVVGRQDVSRPKPDPAAYLVAAEALGVAPACCLVIEDSPLGIEAALAAGATVIALTTTEPADKLGRAHAVLAGFEAIDLDEWLAVR